MRSSPSVNWPWTLMSNFWPSKTGKASTEKFSAGPLISCLVPGRSTMAFTTFSAPIWRLSTVFSNPPAILDKFREPPSPPKSHADHSSLRWFGISLECWKPCRRARIGIAVFAEKEKVDVESYTSKSVARCVSNFSKKLAIELVLLYLTKNDTYRDKKLLTTLGSTPVTNDGPISNGNVVAVGFGAAEAEVDGCGISNEIWAIASWSRTSSDLNLRAISLRRVSKGQK